MKFDDINTGEDFELFCKECIEASGNNVTVVDTPTSNDYGADLILMFNNLKVCIQCKYYSNMIGVSAVQEVVGSLNYYGANYGAVITNNSFTQQAHELAIKNNICLIPGFFGNKDVLQLLTKFISGNKNSTDSMSNKEELLTVKDLVVRYGVNSNKIYKDVLGAGLPYTKVGREYRFKLSEVIEWEKHKRYIPIGRNDIKVLPGYSKYHKDLTERFNSACENGDKQLINEIKREAAKYGIHLYNRRKISSFVVVTTTIVIILVLLEHLVYYY